MSGSVMGTRSAAEHLLSLLSDDGCEATEPRTLSESEWNVVVAQASLQGVAPFTYRRLQSSPCFSSIPAPAVAAMQKAYYSNALRNKRLFRQLADILGALQADGIDVIVLKGSYLAKAVYAVDALRVMGDIDLLIRRKDLARAEDCLLALGYGPRHRPGVESQSAQSQHLIPFEKPNAMLIEIHWCIVGPSSPFRIDLDGLWSRARRFDLNGTEVLTLAPEDLLLHLCIHTGWNNSCTGLRFFVDISETLRRFQSDIDFALLAERAEQFGVLKVVYLQLYLVKTLLNARIPAAVLKRLEPPDLDPQILAIAQQHLTTSVMAQPMVVLGYVHKAWRDNSLRATLVDFLGRLFPSRDHIARKYGIPRTSPRLYLYYLVRMASFVSRNHRDCWPVLKGDRSVNRFLEQRQRQIALQDWQTGS